METGFKEVIEELGPILPSLYKMVESAHEKTKQLLSEKNLKSDPWYFSHTMRKFMESYFGTLSPDEFKSIYPDMTILNMTGISLHYDRYHLKIKKSKASVNEDDNIVPAPTSNRQKRFYNQDDIRYIERGTQLRFEDWDPTLAIVEEENEESTNLKANLIVLYDLDNNYDLIGELKIALPIDGESNSRTVLCYWIQELPRQPFTAGNSIEEYDIELPVTEVKVNQN